jgi:hypothetical protein
MRAVLVDAGYQVLQAESSTALATQVHDPTLVSASAMLLVIGGMWAARCAVPISVVATTRQHSNLAPTCVVLLYELGSLGVLESPDLRHCRTLAMLEKPFELEVLREVARAVLPQPGT